MGGTPDDPIGQDNAYIGIAARGGNRKPGVLAVIPCLNEAAHIEEIAVKLLKDTDSLDLAIVIADGGSTDGTLEIAGRLTAQHPEIFLLENKERIQSAALNRAVEIYGAKKKFLIRVDGHCRYPDTYCRRLVEIQQETGADSVVVSMTAEGRTCFQRAVAAAQNSRLGNGGSAHRNTGNGRFIDHGHHALMLVSTFRSAGGYDESFAHNEDAELDSRLIKAQHRIWLTRAMSITYFPRSTATALFRQYFNYGRGRSKTLMKHRKWPRIRQSLPLAVSPALVLALFSPLQPLLAIPALSWAFLCIAYGMLLGVRSRDACSGMSGIAAMIMHFGWSLGFLTGAALSVAPGLSHRSPEQRNSNSPYNHPRSPKTGMTQNRLPDVFG